MADHTQGQGDPDEDDAPRSLGRRATHDDLVEETQLRGLGELFVADESLDFEEFDGFDMEDDVLQDEFDEKDLEAFFDPDEEVEGLDELRAQLLDEQVLRASDAASGKLDLDGTLDPKDRDHANADFDADSAQEVRVAPDALGSLFSELGEADRAGGDGHDAWALDQVVEEGMSWLMELGEGETGGDASHAGRSAAGSDEGEDWSAVGAQRSKRGSRKALLVLAVLALLAAGGTYGYREFFPASEPQPEQIARRTPPKPAEVTPSGGAAPDVEAVALATEPMPVEGSEIEVTPEPSELAAGPDQTSPNPNDPMLGPRPFAGTAADLRDPFLALSQAGDALPPAAGLPFLIAHFTSHAGAPAGDPSGASELEGAGAAPAEGEVVTVRIDPNPERETRGQRLGPGDMVLIPEADLPFRLASAEDLRGVWPGATIPVDRIDAPERLLTPDVGRVRVVLTAGEVFDGILYAVGEKKVWLEFSGGRMALISWQIEKIEHLESATDMPELGGTGSGGMVGLERVRVRTPGGVFYGKLLNRDGHRVTLLTSDGARITLEHAEVEPAGRSNTRIIDTSGVDPDDLTQAP